MSTYRKWVLTLGIIVATPGISMAGLPSLFPFFKSKAARSERDDKAVEKSSESRNQRIADNIAAALRDASLTGYDIAIEYQGGRATLTGSVDNSRIKSMVTEITSGVPSVVVVDNQLAIKGSTERFSPATTADFQTEDPFAGRKVQPAGFDSESQTVVPPRSRRPIAKRAFHNSVDSRSNQEIAQEVADALTGAGLSGYEVEIRVSDGTALLTGTVSDDPQRVRAGEAASMVDGIVTVDNRLQVAGGQMPDGRLVAHQATYGYPVGGGQIAAAAHYQPEARPAAGTPVQPMPQSYGHPGPGAAQAVYNLPNLPEYAWPSYASYPNYAQVTYPQQYSASAWPYIGPFYPYPQIPLGWRQVQLEWDDGSWNLNFRPRTDKWYWFLNPKNW